MGINPGGAGKVEVRGVSKIFGNFVAVQQTSFEVAAGSFVTLLGPSGSGKTTILKLIAGFEEASTGTVFISEQDVTNIPPHKRNLGFVFQQYALFPHLTVAENIAYPLKMRKLPDPEIRRRVGEALDLIRLSGLQDRHPGQLSGGQQQRVALARAIVFRPPVLLMDEPMSALDKRLREEMQYEIRALQRQLGITTITVTHDQIEAVVMSDIIIVLNAGKIEQMGPPYEVYRRPVSEFVANFVGESNILSGTIKMASSGPLFVSDRDLAIPIARLYGVHEGVPVSCVIRPEAMRLNSHRDADEIQFEGRVVERIFCGDILRVRIDLTTSDQLMVKLLPTRDPGVPAEGSEVYVSWNIEDASIFPRN